MLFSLSSSLFFACFLCSACLISCLPRLSLSISNVLPGPLPGAHRADGLEGQRGRDFFRAVHDTAVARPSCAQMPIRDHPSRILRFHHCSCASVGRAEELVVGVPLLLLKVPWRLGSPRRDLPRHVSTISPPPPLSTSSQPDPAGIVRAGPQISNGVRYSQEQDDGDTGRSEMIASSSQWEVAGQDGTARSWLTADRGCQM